MSASGQEQTVLPEFVKDLLAAEDKRRDSLEARGASVITVSGTLVTLLLGLAALVTKRQDFVLAGTARDLLTAAVLAFVIAALLAIATYVPQPVRITDPKQLGHSLPTIWENGDDFARKKTTVTRIDQLIAAQKTNDWKAFALLAAIGAQVVAVFLVAAAVVSIL